jgi:hypothetical protein
MKKKDLKNLTPKDLSTEELFRIKAAIKAKRPRLSKKLKFEADLLVKMINEEISRRGFKEESELKNSITNPKPQADERKN